MTAEDRMFQMDALRRLAAGELSEIVGPGCARIGSRIAPAADAPHRGRDLHADAGSGQAAMAAYARGVNAYIESHHGRYGFEFALLGYDPRPWSVVDSMLSACRCSAP